MMNSELKEKILSNSFVDDVRISMAFNDEAFGELKADLATLAAELKGSEGIDRELMLSLYSIPWVVRGVASSFDGTGCKDPIVEKLEDAWIELDQLVAECLTD